MTLGQRLLFATAILSIAATATLGYGVREAWRRSEEQRFRSEFRAALKPLTRELGRQLRELPSLVKHNCDHYHLVDDALVGLMARDLERRLSISILTPELAQWMRVDELWLLTHKGEVLGAHAPELVGRRDPKLAATLLRIQKRAEFRESPRHAVLAGCVRRDSSSSLVWVGLLAVRYLDPVLLDIGQSYGVELRLDEVPADAAMLHERIQLSDLGVTVTALRSRLPLWVALRELDSTILWIGGATLFVALLAAFVLSRGLARPLVELAEQARLAMQGEPRPILAQGPREVEESAAAFNRAIEDLVQLRGRLAATERIAAWREIAQRVAHEIKNPLAPIRAALETLRRLRARNDPEFQAYFEEATHTALQEVNRINHIVSEFTEFARMPPPNPAPLDLVELADQVVSLHGNLGTSIRFSHAPCPVVRADRDQIVQVLTNLLQNALDAVKAIAEPRVEVDLKPVAQNRVRVGVRDNGPGIRQDLRERLFLPYATSKAQGTGLGLSIAQRLVIEHGGEIGFLEPESGGTEFFFTLPCDGPATERASDNPLVPGPLA